MDNLELCGGLTCESDDYCAHCGFPFAKGDTVWYFVAVNEFDPIDHHVYCGSRCAKKHRS